MFSKVQKNPFKPLPDSEQITDPGKIIRLLEGFTKRYTPLTARIPGHNERFTSCIVDVDKKHVLLDELLPAAGHKLLLAKGAAQITGSLDGVILQFFTTLKRVDDTGKMFTYHMKLPGLLEYRQRRQDFRVRIPMTKKLPVSIKSSGGAIVKGELHDLSHGGAGMLFLADNKIMDDGNPHECIIELTNGDLIYCTAELRYAKEIQSHNTQFIGVHFVGLLPLQSRLIGRCINEIEREYIRKRTAF